MIVRSQRVVLPQGLVAAAVHVKDGRIVAIDDYRASGEGVIDADDCVVLPGLVDTHVHINEPGRAEWEGFDTATRAAAAGGVTTLVDMPLNSVPATTTAAALAAKQRAAAGRCHVDVAFWGGVVPGNADALEPLAQAGVRGFKCFLSPSGVDEFAHVNEGHLRAVMPLLARLNLPLLVHAELPESLREPQGDARAYQTWLQSRPAQAEVDAIALLVRLAREYRTRVHIVHLATGEALALLRDARAEGLAITVETCPHYLTFAAEEIVDGNTLLKCAPPIRAAVERERLWAALTHGEIDLIASDHSPAPAALKHVADGDFLAAWGGIASLQLGLAVVWTEMQQRKIAPSDRAPSLVARWLSERPAQLAGLYPTKGALAVGADADLVIWDPEGETHVEAAMLCHRHPVTPYDGRRLRGRVLSTFLRGTVVFDHCGSYATAAGRLL